MSINDIKEGDKYIHFKGNIYVILCVAIHTETGEKMVVYKSVKDGTCFCRPVEMFCSPVDKTKYPNVKQEMRFEKITNIDEQKR